MAVAVRRLLIAAYTVLALAASARATVQLTTRAADAPIAYALSAVAGAVYLLLAIALRRTGRWHAIALIAAVSELAGVLGVGTLERLHPQIWPDETVWSSFGAGYGWLPLLLPTVAIVILTQTRQAPRPESTADLADECA
jgi:cytochrome bd-type quinol oxidase subunit 2